MYVNQVRGGEASACPSPSFLKPPELQIFFSCCSQLLHVCSDLVSSAPFNLSACSCMICSARLQMCCSEGGGEGETGSRDLGASTFLHPSHPVFTVQKQGRITAHLLRRHGNTDLTLVVTGNLGRLLG
ncbi:hypothetical protein XENOCAPTIV_000140 [Xenoophorus captivus]|uniref:Uncharacterized protein n=1 Tax=Xenoophorus captivus TaxID=1517983 RepID=A0ABV0QNZ3_9TELE